jgi:Rod binding domain-containing protein
MDVTSLPAIPALAGANGAIADPKHSKIAAASVQFEALLIGQMLKSVREASDDGWLGGGSDSSAESAYGVAENQLAQTIASKGGFGLAKTIQHAMEPHNAIPKPDDPKSVLSLQK